MSTTKTTERFTATDGDTVTVGHIFPRRNGIAGEYTIRVVLAYSGPDWTDTGEATFYGSIYGGPIVAGSGSMKQVFVSSHVTDRIGHTLDAAWIKRFYRADV